MNSNKMRVAGVGLLTAPFFVAGWFIASWLSDAPLQDIIRAEILVVDPPAQFDLIAHNLGFGITNASDIKNTDRIAYSLRAPTGFTAESALQLLKDEFPGVVLNASYQRVR